ncbi:MAG: hypothetical protein AAF995_00535 [Planctomycetota bacterium]
MSTLSSDPEPGQQTQSTPDEGAPSGDSVDPASVPTQVVAGSRPRERKAKRSLFERAEAFVSRLSGRNNFWHRLTSLIWLPYAFRSGITMKKVDETTYSAMLPFRRFNKNWYNAMAGAALLGNSEIAGGMYVFGVCGGDYTVVCKHLEYRFMRPCFGPAEYRITPREDLHALVNNGGEFNITVDMDIVQMVPEIDKAKRERAKRKAQQKKAKGKPQTLRERLAGKEKRVGRSTATFHVTPKDHIKAKEAARADRTDRGDNNA